MGGRDAFLASLGHARPRWSWLVAVGWVAMLVLATTYVTRNGRNLPMQDEWEFIPPLLGLTSGWDWAFEKHYEHRYVLGRFLYLGLHRMTGNWFPAGMVLTLLFLAGSAFLLVRVARRVRGHDHPADLWFPVLLLNAGHYENLLMGYQVVFTLTTILAAVLLAVVARSRDADPVRSATWAGVVLLGIMTGGGIGLLFVPPVGAWIGNQQNKCINGGGRIRRWLPGLLTLGAAVAYAGWTARDLLQAPPTAERHGVELTLRHALEFLAEGVGPIGCHAWPVIGWTVLAVEAATVLVLIAVAARRPAERPVALGWLAVLAGVWLVVAAVGHGRPSGFASRYACVSCLGLCVSLLTAARYVRLPAWAGVPASLALLVLLAIPLCRGDWRIAKMHAGAYRVRYNAMAADVRAGVPVEFVADRHVLFPVPACRDGFRLLHAHGFGPLRGIAEGPPLSHEVVDLPTGTRIPAWDMAADPAPPRLVLPVGGDRPVAAVRLRFRCDDSRYWQQFTLKWVSADGGGVKSSTVYPWLVPGESSTSFWVADRVRSAWVEPGCPTPGLDLIHVEVFRPVTGTP
jgi:hypothetical protein